MKNVFIAAMVLCASLTAQQPPFWGNNHPADTHNHQNGNGHDGNGNDGHNGWGFGHHKPRPPINPPDGDNCQPQPPCPPTHCPPPPPPRGDCPAQPVPEPGTLLLVGTGLAGAAMLRRRKARKDAETAAIVDGIKPV